MTSRSDSPTLVKLVFGDLSANIDFNMDGGLEALTAEAEAQFGLHPDSFNLFDDFGKVEDIIALSRALDMATTDPCVLEVREASQWKKIREMEAKIDLLVARCPVVDDALTNIEERSAKRFEKLALAMQGLEERSSTRCRLAASILEELEAKVSSMAPLLKCVVLQDMELKAKLDALDASLVSEEMFSKVNNGIVPMLQTMALQQMELKEKLDCVNAGSPKCHSCEQLVHTLDSTCKELSECSVKVEEVEEVTKNLQKDMDLSSDSLQEARVQLQALQAEVQHLTEQPHGENILSAMRQDLGKSPKNIRNGLGGFGADDTQWIEGDFSSGISYSKKSHMGLGSNNMNVGGAGAVPFARLVAPRQYDRMQASRSLPYLPPMK